MAEYTINVELLKTTLLNMTGEQIIQALQDYEAGTGTELIPVALIDGTIAGTGSMTGADIVNAINALAGAQPNILYNQIGLIPKSRILHANKSLNLIYTGDPRSSAFQALYSAPNTDRILTNDYIRVAQIYQDTYFDDEDWVIALVDSPTWDYTDTSQWLILPLHKLNEIVDPVFQKHSSSTTGIESIPGGCSALGEDSFAAGDTTTAYAAASTSLGKESRAGRVGEVARSAGKRTTVGDRQVIDFQMYLTTTNAIQTEMILPQRYGFNNNTTYQIDIKLMGVVRGGKKAVTYYYRYLCGTDSDGLVWENGGVIDAGFDTVNPRMEFGTPTMTVSVSVVPDIILGDAVTPPLPGVYKGLKILCTGIANTTVIWTADIHAIEVSNL